MYKAFSDPKNIEKMVREIEVFWEEITLEVFHRPYKLNPFKSVRTWMKYVSTPAKNKRVVFIYWDTKLEDVFIKDLLGRLNKRRGEFNKLTKLFHKTYKDYKKFTDKVSKAGRDYYKNQSNKELSSTFKEFVNESKKIALAYYIPYYLVIVIERLLRADLKSAVKNQKIENEIFDTISTQGISNFVGEERKSFLKALIRTQKILRNNHKDWNDGRIRRIVFKQWYDFGLRAFKHGTYQSLSLDDYVKKFKKYIDFNANNELGKIYKKELKEKQAVADILKRFYEYPALTKHAKWLRAVMNDRNFDSEKVNIYFYHCTDLFYELDKRLGVAKDGYLFLSAEEILKGLEGKLNAQKILKERRGTGFVIKQIGNKVAVSTGVSPKDLHEREATKEITQFEGSPAYKGLVRGKVKVVLGTGLDAEKFKKRDILVTPMTTPKFIPFIKQASAVITDEGGLLCHAAIISRELKTPCIIGTKIATKVLKDEDLIEVDANRGIVKILKRSK